MKRVIDGFNLYFGMVDSGCSHSHCKWLDIELFANTLRNSSHILNSVKYFTSRINNHPDKQKRQNAFPEANETRNIQIIYGEFRSNWLTCKTCGGGWYDFPQKEIRIAFPPGHQSNDLKNAANGSFTIGVRKLENSQLPHTVINKYGHKLSKPESW